MKEGRLQVFVQNNQVLTKKHHRVFWLLLTIWYLYLKLFMATKLRPILVEVQHSLAPAPTQENISFKVQLSEISLASIFLLTPANILLECFEL